MEQGTQYYTNEFGQIVQGGTGGLGWWDQFNPKHPKHPSRGKGKSKATPDEEIISGGTHHIVTLQGTHPLTPEQPPVLLEAISCSASLGETILMYFPPTIIRMSTSQPQQLPQAQANVTVIAAQGGQTHRPGMEKEDPLWGIPHLSSTEIKPEPRNFLTQFLSGEPSITKKTSSKTLTPERL